MVGNGTAAEDEGLVVLAGAGPRQTSRNKLPRSRARKRFPRRLPPDGSSQQDDLLAIVTDLKQFSELGSRSSWMSSQRGMRVEQLCPGSRLWKQESLKPGIAGRQQSRCLH